MHLDLGAIAFQAITFLFAISVHESAHAWMANRCGDPTAKMLGRVTLNPLKHIDPIGTVLLPAIALFSGFGFFGWAKPCPVTPQNFRDPVKDDIWTSVAGPLSNLLLVIASMVGLVVMSLISPTAHALIRSMSGEGPYVESTSFIVPIVILLYTSLEMNVLLGIFNLIPVPPLDGSHVLRHLLPDSIRSVYDNVGMVGIILLFMFGGRFLGTLMGPVLIYIDSTLMSIVR
jgi:Zn-dependent protease